MDDLEKSTSTPPQQARQELHLAPCAENIPGMIFRLSVGATGQRNFLFVSAACKEIFGLSVEEVRANAKSLLAMMHPEDRLVFDTVLQQAQEKPGHFQWHGRFVLRDNSTIWARAVSQAERESDGSILWDGLVVDLPALKDAERQVEESLALQQHFYSNMSNELRPPISGLIGISKLLLETKLDTRQEQMLRNACETAEELLMVVDEMLDYERQAKNKVTLDIRPFSIPNLLRAASGMFRQQGLNRAITLEIHCDERLPEWVQGDADRIKQVLVNLLINSFKFCDSNSKIVLSVDLHSDRQSHLLCQFTVSDSGPSISAEDLQKVFMPFFTEVPGLERVSGGSGLGLAISSNLVELMGGVLEVDPNSTTGACFQFSLALEPLSATASTAGEGDAPSAERRKVVQSLHVLLVEDNQINEIIALRLLERHGHKVSVARDGKEAVEICQNEVFELILMDMEMPVMDGIEATKHIRQIPAHKDVPIVALSAHKMTSQIEHYLKQGLNAYLIKPLVAEELYEIIENVQKANAGN